MLRYLCRAFERLGSLVRRRDVARRGAVLLAVMIYVAVGSFVLPGGMLNTLNGQAQKLAGRESTEGIAATQDAPLYGGDELTAHDALMDSAEDAESVGTGGAQPEGVAATELGGDAQADRGSSLAPGNSESTAGMSGERDVAADVDAVNTGSDPTEGEASSVEEASGNRVLTAETDAYVVTLTPADGADIPDGATLSVDELAEDSEEYAVARDAVVAAKASEDDAFEGDDLGLVALDISILDSGGNEVEPTGDVQVAIEARALPEEAIASELDVRHIVEPAEEGSQDGSAGVAVAQPVEAEVMIDGDSARAEFSVGSFSVFTITWTRDSSSAQRVGNVRLHTVDENGSEITDQDTYTTSELMRISGESGILTIADWVKTKNQTDRTYKEARLGSNDGTIITGLKVAETRTTTGGTTTTSYTLQYTSDTTVGSSSRWHDVKAAISDIQVNNADIYLVFSAGTTAVTRPVNLHFMTLTGEAITDDDGDAIVRTIDAATHTEEYDLASYAADNAPDGYVFDTTQMNTGTTTRCQMILQDNTGSQYLGSSVRGSYYRFMRYRDGHVQMARGDRNWQTIDSTSIDVYVTFISNRVTTRTFTVHYVDERKNVLDGQDDQTFTLDSSNGAQEYELSSGDLVRDVSGKFFIGSYLGSESDSLTQNQGYVTTDYPSVSRVRLAADGSTSFLMAIDGAPFALQMVRSNRWSYTTARGRTFTLRREVTGSGDDQSVRFSLVDDQVSSSAVDLSLSGTSGSTETYVGSTEEEGSSVVYAVTATSTQQDGQTQVSYQLTVSEWISNDQTDIYQVYGNPSAVQSPAITLKNDLVFTGHLVVQMDPALQDALDNGKVASTGESVTDVSYHWYKVVNGTDSTPGTLVERKQNGDAYNLAPNESQRTWLDLAADDGALSSDRQSVQYYCVLTYKLGDQELSATSNRLSMINYDTLQNGGFETPTMTQNQVSNSWYYSEHNGVWRTTGLGSGGMANHDIEIVNDQWSWAKSAYNWNTSQTFAAREGHQFAELNCEAAGALYQDVVTLPYENLNYWLSHRARGRYANGTPEYDTMYLVIMPTKTAMTSGANGGELKEQSELQAFIESHGGFSTTLATSQEATVTYRDSASGILIERISSDDQSWHDVSVANGYTAMAGLTRFFFVAGPTASGSNTVGNFLDGVGFSQDLPEPSDDEFQVVVTKTFSNLDLTDIGRLADNNASDPFTLTIRAYDSEATAEARPRIGDTSGDGSNGDLALDHARLTFSVSSDEQLTPKATAADGSDLFALGNGSNGTVTSNDDTGTVTMTWTLLDNAVDGTKYYAVDESGEDLAGYANTATQSGSVQHEGSTSQIDTTSHVASITGGDVLRMGFTNTYNRNNQIRVQKVFSGITPTTVNELSALASPFTVTVTNQSQNDDVLHLVYDEQRPYADASLPQSVEDVEVSFRQGSGGVSIVTWTITGWDAGNYLVQESGYHPQGEASRYNTLAGITINGATVSEELPEAQVSIAKDVIVGGDNADGLSVKAGDNASVRYDATGTVTLSDEETDLLVVQYRASSTTGYLVWTPQAVGVNVRQAILNHIKEKFNDDSASLDRVTFYSSENPGVMQVNDASVTYDATTRQVTFASSVNTIWQSYYSTPYTLERTVTVDGKTTTEVVANDEPEIRIRNNYNPIIKIQKIERGHNDRLLGGASFQIYRYADGGSSGTKEYYLDSSALSSPTFGQVTEGASAKTFTTAEEEGSALGTVNVGVLPEGTYYLQETEAPAGYNRISDIGFYVSGEGVVTLMGDGGAQTSRTDYAEVTLTDPFYTITVSDELGALLPAAGGLGGIAMSLAYLAGLAAVTVASGAAVLRRGRGSDRTGH